MWGSQGEGGGGCNVFLIFYAIYNISRKKIILGIQNFIFFEKNNYFSFNVFFVFFLCPEIFFNINKNNIEKCPFTYWLNGRWFLQIVDRDSWNLYPLYPLFRTLVLIFRKKNCGIQKTIISHLMFSLCFFYAGNIEKCPFTYWLNGRWFLQIVDIGNFNMRLEILKSAPSLLVKWEVVSPNRRYTCREF